LLGKIVPDKAEHAAKGHSLGKCDNDGWCDFARNPKGHDDFLTLLRCILLA
jgi:hypothetical protein